MHSRPWANYLLIIANLGVFAWQMADPSLMFRHMLAARSPQLVHFFTYAFLHLDAAHLIFNIVVLYMLGDEINERLGQVGYSAFYLGGAVFSGIGFLLAGGHAIVGASGAIGAVMGAYLALLPRASITMHFLRASADIPAMYFILIYFLYNLVMSLIGRMGVRQVAYEAHLAGMIFGFAVAFLLLLFKLLPRSRIDFLSLTRRPSRA